MKYSVYHKTLYKYSNVISGCHNIASLAPREYATQKVSKEKLTIFPQPEATDTFTDAFKNRRTYFSIPGEHQTLEIVSEFQVEMTTKDYPLSAFATNWKEVAANCEDPQSEEDILANQFLYPTEYTEPNEAIINYAEQSFAEDSSVYEVAMNLMGRIFNDFEFDGMATSVDSKPKILIENKRGVCQDFAQFFIACMKSKGIPAKYISGYILTHPPEGEEKLFGVDASHAWVAVYCPIYGWLELDPTNNIVPGKEHIKIAEGRDYHDIQPVKGIFLGNGFHELEIAVDVRPLQK